MADWYNLGTIKIDGIGYSARKIFDKRHCQYEIELTDDKGKKRTFTREMHKGEFVYNEKNLRVSTSLSQQLRLLEGECDDLEITEYVADLARLEIETGLIKKPITTPLSMPDFISTMFSQYKPYDSETLSQRYRIALDELRGVKQPTYPQGKQFSGRSGFRSKGQVPRTKFK